MRKEEQPNPAFAAAVGTTDEIASLNAGIKEYLVTYLCVECIAANDDIPLADAVKQVGRKRTERNIMRAQAF